MNRCVVKIPMFTAAAAMVLLAGSTGLGSDSAPVARWIPSQAVLLFEVPKPSPLLDPLLSAGVTDAVRALPAYKQLKETRKFKEFQGLIAHLETQLQADWQPALRQLVGGGLAFAVGPGGETLLCADSEKPEMWEKLHETFLGFAKAEAEKANQPERVVSREYRGVTGWKFGPNEAHVIVGPRLFVSNRPEVLGRVLDLRAEGDGDSIAGMPAYQAAKAALGAEAVATVYLNMEAFRQAPGLKRALAESPNPMAALLFEEARKVLQHASWLGLGAYVKNGRLTLKAVADQPAPDPKAANGFSLPAKPQDGALPNLPVPGGIAALSLYRDLHGFYAAKDTLFPERTSGLIFFENMMGIFFSGLDLTEEVLGQTTPEIRLVAARQEYDAGIGTPGVRLPAFAAVFGLEDPEKFGAVAEEAWQKALGLVNFTRGQKALPGLIIDKFTHGQTQGTVAYYRASEETNKTSLDLRYNFRPALARVGHYLILSSTDGLARDLIDALRKEMAATAKPISSAHSLLELNGANLRDILSANRANLVRKNMIDKGHSREKAESETDFLLTLLDWFRNVKLGFGQENGRPTAQLELDVRPPHQDQARTQVAPAPAVRTADLASNTTPTRP